VTTAAVTGARGWVRAMAIYAAVSLALIAAGAWLLGLAFASPDERRAVWTSAAIAWVVQQATFVLVRRTSLTNPFAGYGAGMLVRFAVLALYAFVFVNVLALPSAAALLSLATFFFVSTLVEPPLLKL
jgi:hypothetical protein